MYPGSLSPCQSGCCNCCGSRFALIVALAFAFLLPATLSGTQVSREIALRAASGWLARSPEPMGVPAGSVHRLEAFSDATGTPLFYVLTLEPTGYIVLAADDDLEPVVAFSSDAAFIRQPGTPLLEMLKRDLRLRLELARRDDRLATRSAAGPRRTPRDKWRTLLDRAPETADEQARALATADVSDVCVAPMVKSRWDQVATVLDPVPPSTQATPLYIFNYYTPPYQSGSPYNYPAGCSAVAWAQIMRYHEWPKTAIGRGSYEIGIDGYGYRVSMLGGDGAGGPYDWSKMPLRPDASITTEQTQAIGRLMHDAGVGTGVGYYYFGTYGSTNWQEIETVFHYAEAKTCVPRDGLTEVMNAMRTSLDAGLPANLNIFTEDGTGHALVVDGYGYIEGTRYHHLNMGWGGHADAWYNLPPIDVQLGGDETKSFSIVQSTEYNIDPLVAGEMITGRITTEDGKPVAGATLTLDTVPARSTTTSARGIYAFKGLPAKAVVTVTAVADGYTIAADHTTVTLGDSAVEVFTTPNRIADFRAAPLAPKVVASPSWNAGATVVLSVPQNAAQTGAWHRNGAPLAGATGATFTLSNLQPGESGLYGVTLTQGGQPSESDLAIIGLDSAVKVIGSGREVQTDVFVARNGNTFDQVLLEGAAATITSDHAQRQITRVSFVDLDDDIVQVEYSGPGALSLVLDNPAGPALPANYEQNVRYMKGHVGIVITGATVDSHVSVFSVGRANAVQQFIFKPGVSYDGIADIAFVAISSRDGKFGGVRAANANFFAVRGVTGVYAPGVAITGPLYLGDITAADAAQPMIRVGSAADVRITGGDLYQTNSAPIRVTGLESVAFRDGSDSHGNVLPAQPNRGVLYENGQDVTSRLVAPSGTATASATR